MEFKLGKGSYSGFAHYETMICQVHVSPACITNHTDREIICMYEDHGDILIVFVWRVWLIRTQISQIWALWLTRPLHRCCRSGISSLYLCCGCVPVLFFYNFVIRMNCLTWSYKIWFAFLKPGNTLQADEWQLNNIDIYCIDILFMLVLGLLHLKSTRPLWKILENHRGSGDFQMHIHYIVCDIKTRFITEGADILYIFRSTN